jgi:hypothetical protein
MVGARDGAEDGGLLVLVGQRLAYGREEEELSVLVVVVACKMRGGNGWHRSLLKRRAHGAREGRGASLFLLGGDLPKSGGGGKFLVLEGE